MAIDYSEDRQSYTNGKSAFIESVLHSAEQWRKH